MLNLLLAPISLMATQIFSTAINIALAKDPVAQKKLKGLRDCVLELQLTNLKQSLFVIVNDTKIDVVNTHEQSSVTLSGSLFAFIKLATAEDKQTLFRSQEIVLSGDAVRAQQIMQLVDSLDIDWDGIAAEVIGDIPANAIGSTFRSGWSWTKNVSESLRKDLEEFVKFELRLLPSKPLAKKQFDAIDQVRLATDRLEAKLKNTLTKVKQS